MKRLLPLFLAVILCFTFVGCSEANDQTPQAESPSETITQKNNFEAWLIGTKNYSSRGAKDVISRCKRAEKMVPSNGEDEAHYIFALEQNEEFHCLSVNVRSQIKREGTARWRCRICDFHNRKSHIPVSYDSLIKMFNPN